MIMNKTINNKNNNKKMIKIVCGIGALVIALAIIAGIWAYYRSENSIMNEVKTAHYGNQLVEKFTPVDKWQPGQEIEKEVFVENTGTYDLFVRIKMEETWTLSDNTKVTLDSKNAKFLTADEDNGGIDGGSVVYKKFAADMETYWTFDSGDGYWYYNEILEPKDVTSPFLESITLALDTNMGDYKIVNYYTTADIAPGNDKIDGSDTPNASEKWVAYDAKLPVPKGATFTRSVSQLGENVGYADATYTLTITSQFIQATAATPQEADWDLSE